MMQSIGQALTPIRVDVLNALTDLFTKIGTAAAANPETVKAVAGAILGLATGLVALGTGAGIVALAGIIGPVGAGIVAVTAAFGALLAVLPELRNALSGVGDAFQSVTDRIKGIASGIGGLFYGPNPMVPAPPNLLAPNVPHPFAPMPGSPGDLLHKQSWEPGQSGGGGGAVQVHNVIYLDGTTIAQAVNDYTAAGLEHPRQASYFNGLEGYTAPDYQPVSS